MKCKKFQIINIMTYLNASQKLEKLLPKSNFGSYQQILKILYQISEYLKIIYRIYSNNYIIKTNKWYN
jgi:hypothetical protein